MPANCVVCSCPAEVYCHHDRAYLCSACDAHVHNAHVLARSHHRVPISCAPAPEDVVPEVMDNVVQQDFLPFEEKLEKDSLACVDNLSFSDDAWFAVPDTVCSNADSHTGSKGGKAKDFGYDDLFELDAALDDDIVGLELDRVSSDLLADCLVPDADVTPEEVNLLCQEESTPSSSAVPDVRDRRVIEEPATAAPLAQTPLTTIPHHPSAMAAAPAVPPYTFSTQPPVADLVPNFDTYIPASLLPVDPVMRSHALSDRRDKVQRFREKKKNRQFKKLIRYASRKRYAEVRPRIKGRFARKDEIAAAKAAGVPLTC